MAKLHDATRTAKQPKLRGGREQNQQQKPHNSGNGKRKNRRVFEIGRDRNCKHCEGTHWDPDCPSKPTSHAVTTICRLREDSAETVDSNIPVFAVATIVGNQHCALDGCEREERDGVDGHSAGGAQSCPSATGSCWRPTC